MIIKDYLDAVFMNTTEDGHENLKEEIYNNTLDEIDDLKDQGIDPETAEKMIIRRLGPINKFRKSLGIKENYLSLKYFANLMLLLLHITFNLLSLIYSVSFYIPGVNFTNIFNNFEIELYYIVIFVLLSSTLNLVLVILLLTKAKTKIVQEIHWSVYIIYLLTLPFSLLGIYPLLINKNKYIMHYFNIRIVPSNTKRRIQLRIFILIMSLIGFVLITVLIANLIRKDYLVEEYNLLIFNYSDDINGVNIYGSIQVYALDDNNSFITLEIEEYFHSSNFPDYSNPITNIRIIEESRFNLQEELILGDKNNISYTATINSNTTRVTENIIIELNVCPNYECSEILYTETFHAEDMEVREIKNYETKWIWNRED